ncbi:MAG: hypothetical protein QOH01_3495 [Verrucomicrobiota bacterium]|jgi:hypothetical protein
MSSNQIAFLALLIGAGQLLFAALFFFGIDYKRLTAGRAKKGSLADITFEPKRRMTTRSVLVLLLIFFGFVFAGYGFYRTFDRPAPEQELARLRETVKRFEDRAAEDSAREWRALTPQEITKWADALRPFRLPLLYVFWNQEVEARRLFASIKAAGKGAGIPDISPAIGGADPGEIIIETQQGDPAGPVMAELCKALTPSVKLKQGGTTSGIIIYLGEKPR